MIVNGHSCTLASTSHEQIYFLEWGWDEVHFDVVLNGCREIRKEREIAAAIKEEEKKKREDAKAAAVAKMKEKLEGKKGGGKSGGKGKK